MRFSIFKKGEQLKDKVVCEGEIRGEAYFTFKDLWKICDKCKEQGEIKEVVEGLETGKLITCPKCKGSGLIKDHKPPQITLKCDGDNTYLKTCTCKHHSINKNIMDMKQLCSYVLAVYKALPIKNIYPIIFEKDMEDEDTSATIKVEENPQKC